MRSIFLAAACFAVAACSGGSESGNASNDVNALTTDNMLMDQNMSLDSNGAAMGMNMDAGAAADSNTQNLLEKDATTNDRDTNLANGI